MIVKVYPYRQKDGRRSILEAVDLDDAKKWLSYGSCEVELCEVEMLDSEFRKTLLSDNGELVDSFLATSEIYKVGK